MIRQVKMEFFKMKRRGIGLVLLGVAFCQFMWGQWIMRGMKPDELAQGWMSLMYTMAQLNCIMMPITMALLASRVSDIEHKGNTFKLLGTMQDRKSLFYAKLIYGLIYVAAFSVIQAVVMIVISQKYGFTQMLPIGYFVYFIVMTAVVDMVLLLLQLVLSMNIINQTVAFAVAIGGSLLGIYSLFFSKSIMRLVLWSYYCLLTPVRMDWDKATRITHFSWVSIELVDLGILVVSVGVLFVLGKNLMRKREC